MEKLFPDRAWGGDRAVYKKQPIFHDLISEEALLIDDEILDVQISSALEETEGAKLMQRKGKVPVTAKAWPPK